ncbi:MAG: hypothetical protein ACE14S_03920 [Candidatus Bathyarchaeia archaeon]
MGELTRTIALQVPTQVAYQAVKDTSYVEYTQDLRGKLVSNPPQLVKDIPNNTVAMEEAKWGLKLVTEYVFRPLGEESCEVTIKFKYSTGVGFGGQVGVGMMTEIDRLKKLEIGYKAGKENRTNFPPPP